MLLRRTFAGVAVLFGLSVWSWTRADDAGDHRGADPVRPAVASAEHAGGNHDDAAYRFRTSQARHWRQVMIGGR
jgi:hypothetical protein